MWFAVGAAVADVEVRGEDWDVVDALYIIHPVFIGDIAFAAEKVKGGGVQLLQMILGEFGHAGAAAAGIGQNSAITDDCGFDARVGSNLEGLQPAAGHSCDSDFVCIELFIVLTGLVAVLRDGPIDGIGEEWGFSGTSGSAALAFGGHGTDGDDEKTVRGDFGKEVDVFPG